MIHPKAKVHPSADVDPCSTIGEGVEIWRWTCVREGALIGVRTKIGQHCYVDVDVWIGPDCRIQNSVNVFRGVRLEPGVFVGPGVQFTNVRRPKEGVVIDPKDYEKTVVQPGAMIGAGAIIRCGITIGVGAAVGAGAVVTRYVPPHMEVHGNPARPVRHRCADYWEPSQVGFDRFVVEGKETLRVHCKGCGKEWTT